jgi:ribosomal protein S18 acetylase RimI-like enzyme
MAVTIREANLADAPVICEYNRRLAQESEGKTLEPAIVAKGVAAVLSDAAKGRYFVAEEHQEVVGQIMIAREWSDWRNAWMWWIESVYVRADARRRGIFRALYEHVYQAACEDPTVVGLRLYVERDNHAAQQTYLRLGMEPMGFLMFHKFPLPKRRNF